MTGPARTVLFGLADERQAREVGALGIDAAIVDVGSGDRLDVQTAQLVARALPPLTVPLALIEPQTSLPDGFWGAVVEAGQPVPARALLSVVRVEQEHLDPRRIPADADAVWVRPGSEGTSSATRFDYRALERLSGLHRLILELPDGAAGAETALRLARPYALLFGEAVWHHPGIIDMGALEEALATVARLNKSLLSDL